LVTLWQVLATFVIHKDVNLYTYEVLQFFLCKSHHDQKYLVIDDGPIL